MSKGKQYVLRFTALFCNEKGYVLGFNNHTAANSKTKVPLMFNPWSIYDAQKIEGGLYGQKVLSGEVVTGTIAARLSNTKQGHPFQGIVGETGKHLYGSASGAAHGHKYSGESFVPSTVSKGVPKALSEVIEHIGAAAIIEARHNERNKKGNTYKLGVENINSLAKKEIESHEGINTDVTRSFKKLDALFGSYDENILSSGPVKVGYNSYSDAADRLFDVVGSNSTVSQVNRLLTLNYGSRALEAAKAEYVKSKIGGIISKTSGEKVISSNQMTTPDDLKTNKVAHTEINHLNQTQAELILDRTANPKKVKRGTKSAEADLSRYKENKAILQIIGGRNDFGSNALGANVAGIQIESNQALKLSPEGKSPEHLAEGFIEEEQSTQQIDLNGLTNADIREVNTEGSLGEISELFWFREEEMDSGEGYPADLIDKESDTYSPKLNDTFKLLIRHQETDTEMGSGFIYESTESETLPYFMDLGKIKNPDINVAATRSSISQLKMDPITLDENGLSSHTKIETQLESDLGFWSLGQQEELDNIVGLIKGNTASIRNTDTLLILSEVERGKQPEGKVGTDVLGHYHEAQIKNLQPVNINIPAYLKESYKSPEETRIERDVVLGIDIGTQSDSIIQAHSVYEVFTEDIDTMLITASEAGMGSKEISSAVRLYSSGITTVENDELSMHALNNAVVVNDRELVVIKENKASINHTTVHGEILKSGEAGILAQELDVGVDQSLNGKPVEYEVRVGNYGVEAYTLIEANSGVFLEALSESIQASEVESAQTSTSNAIRNEDVLQSDTVTHNPSKLFHESEEELIITPQMNTTYQVDSNKTTQIITEAAGMKQSIDRIADVGRVSPGHVLYIEQQGEINGPFIFDRQRNSGEIQLNVNYLGASEDTIVTKIQETSSGEAAIIDQPLDMMSTDLASEASESIDTNVILPSYGDQIDSYLISEINAADDGYKVTSYLIDITEEDEFLKHTTIRVDSEEENGAVKISNQFVEIDDETLGEISRLGLISLGIEKESQKLLESNISLEEEGYAVNQSESTLSFNDVAQADVPHQYKVQATEEDLMTKTVVKKIELVSEELGEDIMPPEPPWEDKPNKDKIWLIGGKNYPAWNNWNNKKTR
ncbi:hypothetical protein [Niallia circulans]|uniref:hypothetical protein n=1 Tax=Niallia circulans TaxID=1397 RepID=UPI0026EE4AF7|nr:hypothetical protein [Niallia circulans]